MTNRNFYSREEPLPTAEGDVWFAENKVFLAKRKGSRLIWE